MRRSLLSAAACLLVVSAAHRTVADTGNVDIDTSGYAGTSTGGWACGPMGRARYAGLAANVTVSERGLRHSEGSGFRGVVGAAIEQESVQITGCPDHGEFAQGNCDAAPPGAAMGALQGRLGYGTGWFGIEAGALGFQGWDHSSSLQPGWAVIPQLQLQIGPPSVIYGVVGFGSNLVTSLRRPGILFAGFGGAYDAWGFDLRFGLHRAGPATLEDLAQRFEFVARVRVLSDAFLCPGFAVQGRGYGGEGSLTMRWEL